MFKGIRLSRGEVLAMVTLWLFMAFAPRDWSIPVMALLAMLFTPLIFIFVIGYLWHMAKAATENFNPDDP